jgi:hypothetical protein
MVDSTFLGLGEMEWEDLLKGEKKKPESKGSSTTALKAIVNEYARKLYVYSPFSRADYEMFTGKLAGSLLGHVGVVLPQGEGWKMKPGDDHKTIAKAWRDVRYWVKKGIGTTRNNMVPRLKTAYLGESLV